MPIIKSKTVIGLILGVCMVPVVFLFMGLGAKLGFDADGQFLFWLFGLFCISMFGKLIIWLTTPKKYKPYYAMTEKEREKADKEYEKWSRTQKPIEVSKDTKEIMKRLKKLEEKKTRS